MVISSLQQEARRVGCMSDLIFVILHLLNSLLTVDIYKNSSHYLYLHLITINISQMGCALQNHLWYAGYI